MRTKAPFILPFEVGLSLTFFKLNSNGKTGGITHPSSNAQEAVIRQAYKRAGGLDPTLTGYFECHGTGTAVGDPLEMAAIARVFAPRRTRSNPLLVGSVSDMVSNLTSGAEHN